MQRLKLGRTDIDVSEYCLGTMTFGTQTTESDAHTQIDMALDAGIDFLDTAAGWYAGDLGAHRTMERINPAAPSASAGPSARSLSIPNWLATVRT